LILDANIYVEKFHRSKTIRRESGFTASTGLIFTAGARQRVSAKLRIITVIHR